MVMRASVHALWLSSAWTKMAVLGRKPQICRLMERSVQLQWHEGFNFRAVSVPDAVTFLHDSYTTLSRCKQCGRSRRWYEHLLRNARHFSRRGDSDGSDVEARGPHPRDVSDDSDSEEISSDDNSDGLNSDSEIFDAFQSELAADDDDEDDEEKEARSSEKTGQQSEQTLKDANLKDDYDYRPWNTKERTKACLDKLKKGPDGRYINVLEVATELDMLIASYLKLRKAEDPDHADNSEDDEKYLEGIDIRKFKRLQKRVREGTYEFQPVVLVPLPKRKIVKLKRKKVKKRHAF